MQNFTYHSPTKLIFGKDTHKEIGTTIAPYAKKVLLHYGGQSIKNSGVHTAITESLTSAGIEFVELSGVQPNPRIELVLAEGGGSVIDSSKAIAADVFHDGDPWEMFAGFKPVEKALLVATVLTIPAADSETSSSCVVTGTGQKRGIGGYYVRF